MEHDLTKEQMETIIFLGKHDTKYSKEEITELGIFPTPPKVLPDWVAQKIKNIDGKYFISTDLLPIESFGGYSHENNNGS